jgi:hypothetical protein
MWVCGNQAVAAESTKVSAATNKHTILEEPLEVVTSIRSFPKLSRDDT